MAMQRHPPPAVSGKRIKPKYMAQTKARPPTFVLFSSRADQMPDHYRRYLINSLRESFDLPGVPLRITIKSGANPYADGEAKGHSGRGKREFERREREEERIRASRNTVKKSKRIADEAAAAAAAEAGLPPPEKAPVRGPKKSVKAEAKTTSSAVATPAAERQVGQEAGAARTEEGLDHAQLQGRFQSRRRQGGRAQASRCGFQHRSWQQDLEQGQAQALENDWTA
jgi:GTP-binding protein